MLFLPLLIAHLRNDAAAAFGELDRDLAEKGARLADAQREQVQALRAARVGPWAATKPTSHAYRQRGPKALADAVGHGRRRKRN